MQKQNRNATQQTSNVLFQSLAEFQAVAYSHAMSLTAAGLHTDDALTRAATLLVRANDEKFMSALLDQVARELLIKNPLVEQVPESDVDYTKPNSHRPYGAI